jgi:hypothetical protein
MKNAFRMFQVFAIGILLITLLFGDKVWWYVERHFPSLSFRYPPVEAAEAERLLRDLLEVNFGASELSRQRIITCVSDRSREKWWIAVECSPEVWQQQLSVLTHADSRSWALAELVRDGFPGRSGPPWSETILTVPDVNFYAMRRIDATASIVWPQLTFWLAWSQSQRILLVFAEVG